jgi:HEAT repeat protein
LPSYLLTFFLHVQILDLERDMRSTKPSKAAATSNTGGPLRSRSLVRSEWPLLLYPVLVAVALIVLYLANRPDSQDRPHGGGTSATQAGSETTPAPADVTTNDSQARAGDTDPTTKTRGNAPLPGIRNRRPPVGDSGRKLAGGAWSKAMEADHSWALPEGGPADKDLPIIGMLRQAVQTNDQAALKSCLDRLVALGDQAVAPLSDVIAKGEDASAVWAAEALARIGTPAATQSLLDLLGRMPDGLQKEQIAQKLATIRNHDSWPILLDAVQTSEDAIVRRVASTSLSQMADAPIVDELVTRYDASATVDEAEEWARTVANISSSKATESLLTLARQVPSNPEDPLDQAVLSAIAKVGDAQCISYLLTRLEASEPGEGAYLMNLIGMINQPQAQASLLYAAAGNKEVSAEQGRTAAILALRNYPNEQTYVLLEQIASTERNAAVATAASRTLADIQRVSPMLATNAQFRPDEQIVLPSPVQK